MDIRSLLLGMTIGMFITNEIYHMIYKHLYKQKGERKVSQLYVIKNKKTDKIVFSSRSAEVATAEYEKRKLSSPTYVDNYCLTELTV